MSDIDKLYAQQLRDFIYRYADEPDNLETPVPDTEKSRSES